MLQPLCLATPLSCCCVYMSARSLCVCGMQIVMGACKLVHVEVVLKKPSGLSAYRDDLDSAAMVCKNDKQKEVLSKTSSHSVTW